MKPRKRKRLLFRKVKRRPARPVASWRNVRLHIGNTVHDLSGCIILAGDAFRGVAASIHRAAAGIGAAVARLPRYDVGLASGFTARLQVQLGPGELAWLQKLQTNPVG